MTTFNNGNTFLTSNIIAILGALGIVHDNTTSLCSNCLSAIGCERHCESCDIDTGYIAAYCLYRGQTVKHPELIRENQTWPPRFITHTWSHFKRNPAFVKEHGDPGTIYDGFVESLLVSLMLQTKFEYKRAIFPFDIMMTLFETGKVKTNVIELIDSLFDLIKTNSVVNPDLFFNTALTSSKYQGSLWTKRLLHHIFGDAGLLIFSAFNLLVGNFYSKPTELPQQLNSSYDQNMGSAADTNDFEVFLEQFQDDDHGFIQHDLLPDLHPRTHPGLHPGFHPGTLPGTHLGLQPLNLYKTVFYGIDDELSLKPTSPTPEKIGLGTVTEKIFIKKTHMFSHQSLQNLVETMNAGIYTNIEGMVDLKSITIIMNIAADLTNVKSSNFDVLCNGVYKACVVRKFT
jgi:hypothetical protein